MTFVEPFTAPSNQLLLPTDQKEVPKVISCNVILTLEILVATGVSTAVPDIVTSAPPEVVLALASSSL